MENILSIIIPTYNMEKYLHKCLDSLIVSEDNMQRLEILVINDGSKDTSSQIAHEYEIKYPQTFRVIDKDNGNYGSCINRGLKEVSGKYVKVLDADDYFDKDLFDLFIAFLSKVDVDMVISDYYQVNEIGNVTKQVSFDLPLKERFSLKELLKSDFVIDRLVHQNIAYKVNNLRKIGYTQTEGISYTDNEWVFKPMVTIESIAYFPYKLYQYFIGREGQTFDPKVMRKSYDQREKVMRSMTDYYSKVDGNCSSVSKEFLKRRLIVRLQGFYHFHLLISGSRDSNSDLISFEEYLKKTAPDIYMELNNSTCKFNYHFVKSWRKSNNNINSLSMIIYRFIRRIRS